MKRTPSDIDAYIAGGPKPLDYKWVTIHFGGRRWPTVNLTSRKGGGPEVDLTFTSYGEMAEMVNTLKGAMNAYERLRKEKRAARRKQVK